MLNREKKTKVIWSISQHSFENVGVTALAQSLLQGHQDALRAIFTAQIKPYFIELRNELTRLILERRLSHIPNGLFPFVFTFIGRRGIFKTPTGKIDLKEGTDIEFTLRVDVEGCTRYEFVAQDADQSEMVFSAKDMLSRLKTGSLISLSYGQVELEIKEIKQQNELTSIAKARIVAGGLALSGMHVHSSDIAHTLFPLIPEDLETLGCKFDGIADFIVVNGVTSEQELLEIKRALHGETDKTSLRHPSVPITQRIRDANAPMPPRLILKLESSVVLDQLETLLPHVDGLFLSRSELGLHVHPHTLPIVQKRVVSLCNRMAKIVIVASELLYSMRVNPNPTRAEVSDIANAVADGTDAILLADEVTEGPYSAEVAEVTSDILRNSEQYVEENWNHVPFEINNDDDAIAYGALRVAEQTQAKAIVCLTEGGYTAMRLASLRTPIHIIAVTYNTTIMRQLNLLRNVNALILEENPPFDKVLTTTKEMLVKNMGFQRGDRIVFVTLTASSVAARNSNLFTVQEIV